MRSSRGEDKRRVGKHFRRMGSISGGCEAFQEDKQHFRRMGSISE
jgi:hypothetical protein